MDWVDQTEVVREWLALEQAKPDASAPDIQAQDQDNEDLARLLFHKPDAAGLFEEYHLAWCQHELTESEFRSLRVTWDTHPGVFEVARDIANDESSLSDDILDRIEECATLFPDGIKGPLVIHRQRWFGTGPFLADGNHRATGLALHMLCGGDYVPQTGYLGYPSIILGWTGRLRGQFHRFLQRL